MTFDLVKILGGPPHGHVSGQARRIPQGHHSSHGHAEHHRHAPLPFLASPVNPDALSWARKRKHATPGLKRSRTVAQFHEEHGKESALAHRIFRKQHEASTLELFFDLFFVANLAVFTTKSAHVNVQTLSNYVGFFVILWTTWFHFSMYDVRFYVDCVFTRICKFLSFGVMVSFVALTPLYEAIVTNETTRAFQNLPIVFLLARLLLVIQYGTVLYFVRDFEKTLLPLLLTMSIFVMSGVSFLLVRFEGGDNGNGNLDGTSGAKHVSLWYVIICVETICTIIVSCVWRVMSFKHTHLVERVGLLTLIVMGEGIIGLVKSITYAIQGVDITIIQETGITAAAVLLIYLIYVLYFDNIDHHRFGSIGQQIWTLLHFPAHCAILLTVEGSTALIIWNACQAAIAWITEQHLPRISDPVSGVKSMAEFISKVNDTYYETAARYSYKDLTEYYSTFPDDLAKLNKTKSSFGTNEWSDEVRPVLQKMVTYYKYFVYNNFGAEGPMWEIDREKDYGKKVSLFEEGFKFTTIYFYIAAGVVLMVLAALYWFTAEKKSRSEWCSIGIRLLGGMALPVMIVSPLTEGENNNRFRFTYSYLLIPIVAFTYLLVLIVDNIVKAVADHHYTIIDERRKSRYSTFMSTATKSSLVEDIELSEDNTSYDPHRRMKTHGSPQLVAVQSRSSSGLSRHRRGSISNEEEAAPLAQHAQNMGIIPTDDHSHATTH